MSTKTRSRSTVALIPATASPALFGGSENRDQQQGGCVVPGSLDGANPVYHPDTFGNRAVARECGFVKSRMAPGTGAPTGAPG